MDVMSRSDRRRPQRATFRLPLPALFFPVLLFFCITPLATSGGAWAVLFAVPVVALAWVVVTRTKATPTTVTAYGLLGAKSMQWTELAGLELPDARWAIAVGLDGRRVRLPMVRPRDLPRLAAVSGGSLRLGTDAPAENIEPRTGVESGADAGADARADNQVDTGIDAGIDAEADTRIGTAGGAATPNGAVDGPDAGADPVSADEAASTAGAADPAASHRQTGAERQARQVS